MVTESSNKATRKPIWNDMFLPVQRELVLVEYTFPCYPGSLGSSSKTLKFYKIYRLVFSNLQYFCITREKIYIGGQLRD